MSDWRDMIVGARMTVDSDFASTIENSEFSRQEWGLIMTATQFEIEDAGNPEKASLVANTSELPTIMPELENVANIGPMGAPTETNSNGILDRLFNAFGLDPGDQIDQEKLQAAEKLVQEYANALQSHLETESRWEEVRKTAHQQQST